MLEYVTTWTLGTQIFQLYNVMGDMVVLSDAPIIG